MAVNKVVYGNDTLIDLTSDTVTSATMLNGTTAHDASGTLITGSYAPALEPLTVKSGSVPVIYTPPSGVDGYSQVTVQKMNIDEQERIVSPSSSMQRITPSSGYDGLSSVAVLGATLQDKTVTPTTYQQTVTKDFPSSYYGLGTVTVEAIPATDITPSNSSPATITSGDLYSAQGSGYAIESYDEVTPSSTPESVSSGDIVKIGGSGVIVDAIPTPTSLTPSNSSPATITSGETYTATANGKAVASITNIIPLNSSPVRLAGFTPYVINSGSSTEVQGYAIESYSAYTPSTTNRSSSRLNIGSIYKIGVRYGYLYGAIPTGRNLFSYTTQPNRDSTSWYTVGFSSASTTVIDGSATVMLDERFAHFADGGEIVVDRDISTAYLAGYAWYGRTSSGTAVYSGVRVLKNGTVITGASVTGSSSTTSPSFKQIETSFAVGDVIKIQTKVSSTSSANSKITVNICTP